MPTRWPLSAGAHGSAAASRPLERPLSLEPSLLLSCAKTDMGEMDPDDYYLQVVIGDACETRNEPRNASS